MNFDYRKLRGRIVEKFGSIKAFADAYGISTVTMSNKLNGKVAISQDDIVKMASCEMLDIPPSRYHEYFFTLAVHESWTNNRKE